MRLILTRAFAFTLALGGSIIDALPQSGCETVRPAKSSGLTLAVIKTSVRRDQVVVNLTATNLTMGRIYVTDALIDQSQTAQLGSGKRLGYPDRISGMSNCTLVSTCMQSAIYQSLSNFSYIEPGETLSFSLEYYSNNPVEKDDDISFSTTLMVRAVAPNGDPDKASPMRPARFNFNAVPIGC